MTDSPLPVRGVEQREADARQASERLPELLARGLRRLAITFVNHSGAVLVKGVPLERLPQVARDGVGFSPVADAFGATGLIDPLQSLARPDGDLRLVPVLDTIQPLDPDTGWAWAAGERHHQDGRLYALDQRGFCRRQQTTLTQPEPAGSGLGLTTGFEIEWMVGRPGGADGWQAAVAGGPYGTDRLIEGLDYLSALADGLDAAGLPWLQLHPEYGSGQFELSLAPGEPLQAADRLVAARLVIQRISSRFGLRCSFSPMLAPDLVGNGGHLHLSATREERPLLGGGSGAGGLTAEGEALVAGLLEQLPALLPLACSLNVSFLRLAPGRWAAPFQVWGVENREAALRLIPAGPAGEPAQLELKVADLSANPYLLLGGVMAAIGEALRQPRPLPAPVAGDPAVTAADTARRLPLSLADALVAFRGSPVLREAMGEALHRTVAEAREAEVRRGEELSQAGLIASTRCWPLSGG